MHPTLQDQSCSLGFTDWLLCSSYRADILNLPTQLATLWDCMSQRTSIPKLSQFLFGSQICLTPSPQALPLVPRSAWKKIHSQGSLHTSPTGWVSMFLLLRFRECYKCRRFRYGLSACLVLTSSIVLSLVLLLDFVPFPQKKEPSLSHLILTIVGSISQHHECAPS